VSALPHTLAIMNEYHSLVRETFVVRLWREATNPAWRGQVMHLPDQESIHFTTLAEVEAFIHRFVPEIRPSHPGDSPGAGMDSNVYKPSGGEP
jgi:hypothetical protein